MKHGDRETTYHCDCYENAEQYGQTEVLPRELLVRWRPDVGPVGAGRRYFARHSASPETEHYTEPGDTGQEWNEREINKKERRMDRKIKDRENKLKIYQEEEIQQQRFSIYILLSYDSCRHLSYWTEFLREQRLNWFSVLEVFLDSSETYSRTLH
jgi:hypothetical protein